MGQRRRQSLKKDTRLPARAAPVPPESIPLISNKEKFLWAGIVLILYGWIATWGQLDFSDLMGYYSLQADAFLRGHLYLAHTPEQGFLQDMVPFEGRYYLQWGPFPALLHMAAKLLGANLSDRVACILAGWLSSLVFLEIMLLLWRRHFNALPKWICRWFFFAFAFATPTAIVALRGTIYHESIAIAALCALAGFLAFLRYCAGMSLHWILLAGIAIALAVATRVTLVLFAAGLFAGIAALLYMMKRPLRPALIHLAAFSAPVLASGLLMMAYNQARFGSPWEYGLKYLPTADPAKPPYALNRVPENFRHYVLAPVRLSRDLPWLRHIGWPPLVHTERAEDMSSLFIASPFLILGGLAWGLVRSRDARLATVRIFTAVAGLSGLAALFTLLCFVGTSRRYMQDFFPMFMIVAFTGVAAHARAGKDWRRWQTPAWAVLLGSALLHLHLIFFQPANSPPNDPNTLRRFVAWSPVIRRILPGPQLDAQDAIAHNELGILALNQGRYAEAIRYFERAGELQPDSPLVPANLRLAREMKAAAEAPGPRGNRN